MWSWLKNAEAQESRLRVFSAEGLLFVKDQIAVDRSVAETATTIGSPELEGLLHQLADEGFVVTTEMGDLLPWDSLYDLLESPAYQASLGVFELPKIGSDAPVLESRGSLADPTFDVSLAGWHDGTGRRLGPAAMYGAVVQRSNEFSLK
jgi:hypothetical protein